jgi:hypothetical protein
VRDLGPALGRTAAKETTPVSRRPRCRGTARQPLATAHPFRSRQAEFVRETRSECGAAHSACAQAPDTTGRSMRCRLLPIPPHSYRNSLAPRGRTQSQRGCGAHTLLDHTAMGLLCKADGAVAFRLDALLQA